MCEAVDKADDSRRALHINPLNVSLAIKVHESASESGVAEQGGKIRCRRGAGMAVLWTLFAAI